MNLTSHDSRIALAFIQPSKRSRFLSLAANRQLDTDGKLVITSRKRLAKYRQMLANLEHWLDPRCPQLPLGPSSQHAGAQKAFAAHSSKSDVYVMSYDEQIDGVIMDLNDVLAHLAKHSVYGTLLVSGTHSLAYYEQCELADLTRLLSAVPAC